MKSVKKIVLALFSIGIFISCQEVEDPVQMKEVPEVFKRFDNFNFQYQYSNVTRIKAIEDRLYYAHPSNPGYIRADLEVEQLCCTRFNQLDFRQSLSKDYIATVDRSLSGYSIYGVERGGNPSFLDLNVFLHDLEGRKSVATTGIQGNFDINGTKMLANIQYGSPLIGSLYIFDLEKNTNFVGKPDLEVIRVEFPTAVSSGNGDRVFKLDAFEDGWIASVATGDVHVSPNYLISKEGVVQRFSFSDDPTKIYMGHVFSSDGRLILNGDREIYISESGKVEDLELFATFNNFFRMRLIEDRMVIWNTSFAVIYEVEHYDSGDPELFNVRKLNNEGMEFSGLNELQVFNGKVFAATSQGLFTKSLEGFWDSAPEAVEEDAQEQAFLDGIEFMIH